MKFQLKCFTLITFCITITLNAACDDNTMIDEDTCVANTTCEWKEKTTGTCGDTTKNTAGENCVGKTAKAECNGKCVFTPGADSAQPNVGTCADGTKLSNNSACNTATTSTACNGGCTWTPDYECTVKTASPGNNTTNPSNSAFRLKSSALISLGLITLF